MHLNVFLHPRRCFGALSCMLKIYVIRVGMCLNFCTHERDISVYRVVSLQYSCFGDTGSTKGADSAWEWKSRAVV